MAISKWIGGILILVAFIIAGRAQADNVLVKPSQTHSLESFHG